jgi:hypothetical protein
MSAFYGADLARLQHAGGGGPRLAALADTGYGAVGIEVSPALARLPRRTAPRPKVRVGSPITMRVRLLPGPALSQREKIFEHVPGERLCYGLEGAFFGSVSSRRCHVVSNAGSSITRYESRFVLGGRLAPVVRALLGRRLARGFEAMTQALRLRAEALAREGGWGR